MALRTSWEGYLRLNLLSVPVKAYSATVSGGGKIGFHMIHKKCNNRIRYKKVCPVHGEVEHEEIASGYEFAKGQFVLVDPDELDKLRTTSDKALSIDVFIRPDALDPMYYNGRTYYLIPDGRVAQKPFAVVQQVMVERRLYAVARVVFSGREQVAIIRPVEGLMAMTLLSYDAQLKKPAAFRDEVPEVEVAAEEKRLAESLLDASTVEEFDFSRYEDEYTGKLTKLIETKAAGKKIVAARSEDEPVVINLMEALRQSLDQAQGGRKEGRTRKAPAKSSAGRKPRRRKTG